VNKTVPAKTPIIPVILITRPMMISLFAITDLPLSPWKSLFAQSHVFSAPARRRAVSLDHLVGAGDRRRRDGDTKSFLGMLFIASARYWIQFVHTAKYKIKPHAIAINTNQIAIFPQLLTCP
jgi:hypothetical protein